jgi:cysteine desulfurase
MSSSRVYLDWNATAPLRPEAREAMLAALDAGNPSSVHAEGRRARAIVERARAQVADAAGCQPDQVVFTSGATEGATILSRLPGPVAADPTAHDCIVAHARPGTGPATHAMGVANGETGVVSALPEAVDGGWQTPGGPAGRLFLDAVQAFGRVPFAFGWSGADFAILSAHKIGGPKGVGALIVREDMPALAAGGGQEQGRRSGTENVAAIAGFGAAAEAAARDLADGVWREVEEIRNILEEAVATRSPETIFVGNDGARLPNTSCFATPGWKGETQVMQMDLAGYAVSSGSACASGKVRSGRVLRAMGYGDDIAGSAIRVSIGPGITSEDVLRFAEAWGAARQRFRARAA